ncbi:MAG: TadE/TadG family type IV pilus assembly protein [Pseudomonadota bacterium]
MSIKSKSRQLLGRTRAFCVAMGSERRPKSLLGRASFADNRSHLLAKRSETFRKDTSGLAALEFGMIAPVMVVLFFAVIEISEALTAVRRLTLSVNTLADLVAQDIGLTGNDLNGLFSGVEKIGTVDDGNSTFTVSSIYYDATLDQILVDWSRNDDGGTPYAKDSVFPGITDKDLFTSSNSLIVAEATHDYAPSLINFKIQGLTIERQALRWPRRSTRVELCTGGGPCP